jgi:hypothetical protein
MDRGVAGQSEAGGSHLPTAPTATDRSRTRAEVTSYSSAPGIALDRRHRPDRCMS